MLGLVFLSVRMLLLSAVDRPSRKLCYQNDKPVVSISPNPHLLASSRRSTLPAHEHRFLETWGDHPPEQDGMWVQLSSITAGG